MTTIAAPSLSDTSTPPAMHPGKVRRLVSSSAIGTIIEWYDYFIFASAAGLVFDRVFFPQFDPATGVILSLMTFAVGFLTRPLGGVVFGIIGDRVGRKQALVWSLYLMGGATFLMGVVPGYATIGIAAPLLIVLLRAIQGVAIGGELAGAILLIAETLPARHRGFWTAWPHTGGPAGNVLAAAVLAGLTGAMSAAAFEGWGWRIGFLLSGLLVALGIWMRKQIDEPPHHREPAPEVGDPAPVRLSTRLRQIARIFFVKAGENVLFYVNTVFLVIYVTRVLGLPRATALSASMVASSVEIVAILAAGALSDRWGRRPVIAVGLIGATFWTFFMFPLIAGHGTTMLFLAVAMAGLLHGAIVGAMGAFFVEQLPQSIRYTGVSIGYQTASVVGGSLTPLIGFALFERFGSTVPVSLYAVLFVVPALAATLLSRETKGSDLRGIV